MTTINDDTHTLFLITLIVPCITCLFACGLVDSIWGDLAIALLEGGLVMHIVNGFLVAYGTNWNVSSFVNGILVLMLVSITIYGIQQSLAASIPAGIVFGILAALFIGQQFVLNWTNSTLDTNWSFGTILIIFCAVVLVGWYAKYRIGKNETVGLIVSSLVLTFSSAICLKLFTSEGMWTDWNNTTFEVTFFDLWLLLDAFLVCVVYGGLWIYVRPHTLLWKLPKMRWCKKRKTSRVSPVNTTITEQENEEDEDVKGRLLSPPPREEHSPFVYDRIDTKSVFTP